MPRLPLILSTVALLVGASAATVEPPTAMEARTHRVDSGYCSFPVVAGTQNTRDRAAPTSQPDSSDQVEEQP